ncbi:MAG TPA: vitamin K epoxide reductase family protein [Anaerolineae bacterium]
MRNRNLWIIVMSVAGLGVSAYLLTVHWGWWQAVCLGVGNCEAVNTSRFSEFLGIPVALLGGLSYIAIAALAVAILYEFYDRVARPALFFLAAVGLLFSAYLTYIELFVLHEICPWCVLSAILITLITLLSGRELQAASAS